MRTQTEINSTWLNWLDDQPENSLDPEKFDREYDGEFCRICDDYSGSSDTCTRCKNSGEF